MLGIPHLPHNYSNISQMHLTSLLNNGITVFLFKISLENILVLTKIIVLIIEVLLSSNNIYDLMGLI